LNKQCAASCRLILNDKFDFGQAIGTLLNDENIYVGDIIDNKIQKIKTPTQMLLQAYLYDN